MTDKHTADLKPCPFCGGEFAIVRVTMGEVSSSGYEGRHDLRDEDCPIDAFVTWKPTLGEVVSLINRRALAGLNPAGVQALVGAASQALDAIELEIQGHVDWTEDDGASPTSRGEELATIADALRATLAGVKGGES